MICASPVLPRGAAFAQEGGDRDRVPRSEQAEPGGAGAALRLVSNRELQRLGEARDRQGGEQLQEVAARRASAQGRRGDTDSYGGSSVWPCKIPYFFYRSFEVDVRFRQTFGNGPFTSPPLGTQPLRSLDTPFAGVTKANVKAFARFSQRQYKKIPADHITACFGTWGGRTVKMVKNKGGATKY